MTASRHSRALRPLAAALLLSSAMIAFGDRAAATPESDAWAAAWAASPYTYCDAKLLAAIWKTDIAGAKAEIGSKIVNGMGGNIPLTLADSRRDGNTCAWDDTGYSYQDAEALAQVWGMDEPYDAKVKAASLYTNGKSGRVERALGR